MNKEEVITRPYEEYYEMIKDMSKDNMIQGLYDLSKNCIEYQNYINQLETNRADAIYLIKEILDMIDRGYSKEQFMPYLNNLKIILERGKE